MMSQQDGEPFRPELIRGVSQFENKDNFQAGTLELNTLGRDNVDEEIRRHGNAAHLAAANERQGADFSGQSSHSSQAGRSAQSGSSGSSSYHQSSSSFSSGGGGSQSGQKSSSNSFQGKIMNLSFH